MNSLLLVVLVFVCAALGAAPPKQLPYYANYDAWGCYTAYMTKTISIPDAAHKMTIERCMDACWNWRIDGNPAQFAGVKNGTTCQCSMTYMPGTHAVADNKCTKPCPGNKSELCGGSSYMQFYALWNGIRARPKTLESYKTWKTEGCWTDSPAKRALGRYYEPSDQMMNVGDCLDFCEGRGYTIGGLEYGRECYCGGAVLGDNRQTSADKCDMGCTKNPKQFCGGKGAINLYRRVYGAGSGFATIPPAMHNWRFRACVPENTANRTMPIRLGLNANTLTVNDCVFGCSNAFYNTAALQNGNECWCGYKVPGDGVLAGADDSRCNIKCPGNSQQICGGPQWNQIYYRP